MKESSKFAGRGRLKPYQLAACVLFVGWIPSLLLAYYSYSVLGRTLERKMVSDAQSLINSLAQHVGNEVQRTGETTDYYRTLPSTAGLLTPGPNATAPAPPPPPPPDDSAGPRRGRNGAAANRTPPRSSPLPPGVTVLPAVPLLPPQEWLESIYYPQRRVDGLFLTDAAGKLVASVPDLADAKRADFTIGPWKSLPDRPEIPYRVSPVYTRAFDGRPVVSVVATVRNKAGETVGYLGADILIERLGRRLNSLEMTDRAVQIVDQNGHNLFTGKFVAAVPGQSAADPALRREFERQRKGSTEIRDRLFFFAPVADTGWYATTEQPADEFYRPVRDLLRETALLVALLVGGTTVAALILGRFYQRQHQSGLRIEQEQLFNEKILANMPLGIALIDPRTERFLHVNGVFSDIATSLGGLPRHANLHEIPFDKVGLASRETLARVLHFGAPFQAVEQRMTLGNGQTCYLTIDLLRLQDRAQRTLGVLCLVDDKTPAVSLREELIHANASKDQFLAQLSHELRNPLSPVLTMVAELETFTDALPATRLPLEVIRRNVELEARLIDDLLDVTRIRNGKLPLVRQDIDVHRTLRLALEICQSDIAAKKLRVELDLRAREHFAHADPARLQQIFWNLLKNAVKFTPDGRRITIRSFNLAAGATAAFEGQTGGSTVDGSAFRETLRVEVADEGIGIDPQHLRRIFNAFDQGRTSVTQQYGGLGLGLAISKAMVEAHGGSLTVASEGEGKGATFTVSVATCPAPANTDGGNGQASLSGSPALPFPPSRAAATAGTANGEPPGVAALPGDGRSVLLVDDHLDTCLGMSRLLRRRGYKVSVAHTVAEALAHANDGVFDLLISDIGLPDGTGFDLMNTLRERGGPPGIALSGYGMESDVNKSKDAGFSEHLTKPVAIDRLDAAMRRLLAPEDGMAAN